MDKKFLEYLSIARDNFVKFVNSRIWDRKFRTEAEDILIAYDQMREMLIELNNPKESEKTK